ncbi:MAG: hypothetical protein ACOYXC_11170 [Candidatus Rifleibacteriota bacterium]
MKRLMLVSLFSFCAALPVFSEVVIKLKNGQTMSLPINQSDISSIEFSSSIPTENKPKTPPQSEIRKIRTFRVTEYERNNSTPAWTGVITRIGESANFQANWKSVRTGEPDKGTLTIKSNPGDNQVTLIRSDNNQTYVGTISADGRTLEGNFNEPGKTVRDRRWTAQIEY